MNEREPLQIRRLRLDSSVGLEMKVLSSTEYQEAIDWINKHFTFAYGQQIDWSHDPNATVGDISDLTEERLQRLFKAYGIELSRRVTVVWAYGDMGITLPLNLIAKHINDIWLPVVDDVFLLDLNDIWCMELHHEGKFSCGRYLSAAADQ